MKLLFASDIHGSALYCAELCRRIEEENPDKIVLLGDLLYHGPRNDLPKGYAPKKVIALLNGYKERIIAVRGNCDSEVDQMVLQFPCMADYTSILTETAYTLFVTHGHLADHKIPDTTNMDAYISGHTHIKQAERKEGVLFINPGSISIPKDTTHSYALYHEGNFILKELNGALIQNIALSK